MTSEPSEPWVPPVLTEPWVCPYLEGARCSVCRKRATHKIGEEKCHDDPFPHRHNFTNYVCCEHFRMVLGEATVDYCRRLLHHQLDPDQ